MPEQASKRRKIERHIPRQASHRSGRYLYAIVANAENRTYGSFGIDEGLVYAISDGQVAAVVSDVPNKKMLPERRRLAAHQEVLRRLMEEGPVLPVSFGIIAEGSKAIQKILSRHGEAFMEQLHRVAGKVEMGLRVTLDVPNIFEYFVNTYRELKVARDLLLCGHRKPTPEDKIEVGRMFDRILNENRNTHTEKVEKILSRYCFEIKRNKCRSEREVMNLACLVGRETLAEFESGVFEVARLFDNNFAFDYNGPWAPHNFVEINFRL